ncbi:MAG: DMT family transporter [Bacteroidia bacterium]
MKIKKLYFAHLALFLVALFYAGNYSIAKIAMPEYISPFAFILLRVGSGAVLFGLFFFLFVREKIRSKRDYIDLAICSFFGIAFNMLAFFKGISLTSPINASVLMLLAPVFVVIFSAIGYRKRINPLVILGILISFISAGFLVNAGSFNLSNSSIKGDLLVMLNATSFAFYLYYVARLLKKYKAITVTSYIFMIGFWFVLPVAYSDFTLVEWAKLPNHIIWSMVYVVVCVTLLAYVLNVWAVQNSSSTTAGSYIYLQPLLAGMIAVAMGMDTLTWQKVVFGLLIVLGLWLVGYGKRRA